MMFGLNDEPGNTNLITRALAHAGKRCPAVPDPTQLEYHLPRSPRFPRGLHVPVPRSYDEFLDILIDRFPHEEAGIRGFYGECWEVRPRTLHPSPRPSSPAGLSRLPCKSFRSGPTRFPPSPASQLQLPSTSLWGAVAVGPLRVGTARQTRISEPSCLCPVGCRYGIMHARAQLRGGRCCARAGPGRGRRAVDAPRHRHGTDAALAP